jgi:hypothetical protein
MPERKAANLASLVSETAPVLVQPRPAEDLHAAGAALVGSRRGNDPSWIKILGL